jgi:hypothetical protein
MARVLSGGILVVGVVVGLFLATWLAGLEGATGIAPPWQAGEIGAGGGSTTAGRGTIDASTKATEDSAGEVAGGTQVPPLEREIDLEGCRDHVEENHEAAVAVLDGVKAGTVECKVYLGPECPTVSDGYYTDGQRAYLVCGGVGPEGKPFGVVPLRYDGLKGVWVGMSAFYSDEGYVQRALRRDGCEIVEGIVVDLEEVIREGEER